MTWDSADYQRERQKHIAATQRREPMLFVSTPGTTTFAEAASVVWDQRGAPR